MLNKEENIEKLLNELNSKRINNENVSKNILNSLNLDVLPNGYSLYELLKRPQITINDLEEYLTNNYNEEIKNIVEIQVKYEGYIAKTNREVEKMLKLEQKKIPHYINYNKVSNIASEARQKLNKIRPKTIAQASRISGVNPTDISVLSIYLKKEYNKG